VKLFAETVYGRVVLTVCAAPVLVAVSVSIKSNAPVVAAEFGELFNTEVTVYVSKAPLSDKAVIETVPAVVESVRPPLALKPAVPLVVVTVGPVQTACEGVELSTPIPNAATATSAMRLKFVFVDICFLSLVVTRNFLVAASR